MTKNQFSEATKLAQSGDDLPQDLEIFNGFGLKAFKPIVCTIRDLAALIRWQAVQFNGNLDLENLNEIWQCKAKFQIV